MKGTPCLPPWFTPGNVPNSKKWKTISFIDKSMGRLEPRVCSLHWETLDEGREARSLLSAFEGSLGNGWAHTHLIMWFSQVAAGTGRRLFLTLDVKYALQCLLLYSV